MDDINDRTNPIVILHLYQNHRYCVKGPVGSGWRVKVAGPLKASS
jgi:hypothetical protein